MDGNERREKILNLISISKAPVSGTRLAKECSVSRQVIVQDIALLRANNYDILSTHKGYVLNKSLNKTRIIKSIHSDDETMEELFTIVDLGGSVVDVFVNHKVYGTIRAQLNLSSRLQVNEFMKNIKSGKSKHLKNITSGYHYHTIEAKNEDILNLIERELDKKEYLVKK